MAITFYNLGHSQPIGLRELIELIAGLLGKTAQMERTAGTARRCAADVRLD